jgi:putative ABC transport system permease protein
MLQDVTFALRLLNRHRGYAATAILTVALGVGANTAVFSIADSVLFRPLPFADADRLFVLRVGNPKTGETYGMPLEGAAVDAARGTGLFDGLAAAPSAARGARAYVRTAEGLDALALSPVSRAYLDLLGVRTAAGRTFTDSDTGTRAVILTYRSWMKRYGGDPAIVGALIPAVLRSIDGSTADDPPLHVVGVLPPRLRLPLVSGEDGVYLLDNPRLGGPGRIFSPLVRLKPGVGMSAAQAQLAALQVPDPELSPGSSELRLVPLREEMAGKQDPVLWLLLAAAATVLLVACMNLANLILARGAMRVRELAVRRALGGSRARLARLLLVEGVVLAAIGTGFGLVAAYWGFAVLSARLPPVLALVADPAFDARALVFAVSTALLAALVFSLVPAIRLSRAGAREGLRLGQLHVHAPRRGRQLLIAAQVTTCVTLLIGAALIGRSLAALLSQDLGFESRRVVATFDLPTMVINRGGALQADTPARMAFTQARLADVRAMPGVRAAGGASGAPYSGSAPDAPLMESAGGRERGGVFSVTSGYFRAIGTPLVAGRDLADAESFAAAPVGLLNETAARELCGSPSACLGFVVRAPGQPPRTVVGVVRDIRQGLQRAPQPAMYVPFDPARFRFATLAIDAADTPESRALIKRTLSTSRDARVDIRSLDDARDREVSPFRFNAIVVGAFAVLTLVLALVGVFGVMAAVVGERTREYGIRLALGATRERVNRLVLRQAAVPIACGVFGGLILAAWGSRLVSALLFGVLPLDLVSFVAAPAIVLAAGLAAAFIPASRAGQVDPIIALRAE